MLTVKFDALVVACFGTTDVCEFSKTFGVLAQKIASHFPGIPWEIAVTSRLVQTALQDKANCPAAHVADVLDRFSCLGKRRVLVVSLFLFDGTEFGKLWDLCQQFAPRFSTLTVTPPLLRHHPEQVAAFLANVYPQTAQTGYLLLGHGSRHSSNRQYWDLEAFWSRIGRPDIRLALLNGEPGIEEAGQALQAQGISQVNLASFLICNGHHGKEALDTLSSPSSQLARMGFQLFANPVSLGQLSGMDSLFLQGIFLSRPTLLTIG